ncbi:PE-PPE domain-containing protein [Mycolicibacterium xanthum]|uniref:PE-PPE domain-containing protein n=1 Tax=Mycolicibacterium xanthum TaxID=2796469 RepID=UPI0027DF9E73|nr:PE-PPE domain-containing protein [Mycolicibacterium xanthum]
MGAAALGLAATVGGVAATQPAAITGSLVDLTALIVVGSSTHPDGSGNENFFGGKFNQAPYNPTGQPGPDLVGVNFWAWTTGIDAALQAHSGEDNAVLSSGWGAANSSLVLSRMDRNSDPALPKTLFILDNNVSRPDGGFGTRYPLFALIGVNPFPSPTDTAAKNVVDIAYQYNYNSNAPADLLNIVAHVNALVAYLYVYRDQDQIDLPVDVDGNPTVTCGGANTCAVLANGAAALPCDDARCEVPEGDRVVAYVTRRGNTTYVTYTVEELPLARLIRDVVPFGGVIADVSEPILKLVVESAYYGGNPIPSDPSQYRPARLMPSPGEIATTVSKVPGAIHEVLEALSADMVGSDPAPVETIKAAVTDEPSGDEIGPGEATSSPRRQADPRHDGSDDDSVHGSHDFEDVDEADDTAADDDQHEVASGNEQPEADFAYGQPEVSSGNDKPRNPTGESGDEPAAQPTRDTSDADRDSDD